MIGEEQHECSIEPNAGWDPRIHIARCGDLVRAYLIQSEKYLVVYDTLLGPKSGAWLRQQALTLSEGRPLLVITSHADWDHYFGNQVFSEPILGSQLCAERILGDPGQKELAQKIREDAPSYSEVRLTPPTVTFPGEATILGGDLTFRLLPTPGHRPDHLSLHLPEISTLLPGDCVEDPIPLVDEDSRAGSTSVSELIATLEKLSALKAEWVLANHAEPERGSQRLLSNLKYLNELQASAAACENFEALKNAHPGNPDWGDFYRKAHAFHLECAWAQRS